MLLRPVKLLSGAFLRPLHSPYKPGGRQSKRKSEPSGAQATTTSYKETSTGRTTPAFPWASTSTAGPEVARV